MIFKLKKNLLPKLPKLYSEVPDRLGPQGEEIAAQYLQKQGYEIIERNFRAKPGEIDIIAREGDALCFVEVKARQSDQFGEGLEAIPTLKKRKLCQTALLYLTKTRQTDVEARFDVVSIMLKRSDAPEIELIKNAFELNEGLF